MRRILAIAGLLAAIGASVALTTGAGGGNSGTSTYTVILDNAFGLTNGADLRISGVRAGKVESLDVDPRTYKAKAKISVQNTGFKSLRADVFCEIHPQSLIGEYFLDCNPGRSRKILKSGSTIGVKHTAGTIPFDLVQDVLRLPYRQRLALILDELGAGLATRGPDLNATIRRAVPALRETDKVLQVLDRNKAVLASLIRSSDTILVKLAGNRRNVGRFVDEARNTAVVSASRRGDLALAIHRLPGFLEELRPTLVDLGKAAREQTPALVDLRAAAPSLTTFLQRLGPFAQASRPAVRALGRASVIGRRAARSARPQIAELRRFAKPGREVAGNLSQILADLDNRSKATEPNPASPGGKGYTGLEALLQYAFDQTQTINSYDSRGHLLKLDLIVDPSCAPYANADTVKKKLASDPTFKHCLSWLGPNQPGITTPDPSPPASAAAARNASATQNGAGAAAASAGSPKQISSLLDYFLAP